MDRRCLTQLSLSLFPNFLFSGLSNIIGIIVYISSNTGDPGDKKGEDKKSQYNYGWSFYFGALSFIAAEMVAVLAVSIYIEKNKEVIRLHSRHAFVRSASSSSPYSRIPSFRYRRRPSRESSHSTEASSHEASMGGGGGSGSAGGTAPLGEISMYTLTREHSLKAGTDSTYSPEHDPSGFLQVHNCFPKDMLKDTLNRRTTPV